MLSGLKCRGTSKLSADWIYGWYVQTYDVTIGGDLYYQHYILDDGFDGTCVNLSDLEVIETSICRCINRIDKFDKTIYEFDIIYLPQFDSTFVLKYNEDKNAWQLIKLSDDGETHVIEPADNTIRWNEGYVITNQIINPEYPARYSLF